MKDEDFEENILEDDNPELDILPEDDSDIIEVDNNINSLPEMDYYSNKYNLKDGYGKEQYAKELDEKYRQDAEDLKNLKEEKRRERVERKNGTEDDNQDEPSQNNENTQEKNEQQKNDENIQEKDEQQKNDKNSPSDDENNDKEEKDETKKSLSDRFNNSKFGQKYNDVKDKAGKAAHPIDTAKQKFADTKVGKKIDSVQGNLYKAKHPVQTAKEELKRKAKKKIKELFIAHPWAFLIAGLIIIVIIILILIVIGFGSITGSSEETMSYIDPEYDYRTTTVEVLDSNNNLVNTVILSQYASGVTYAQIYDEIDGMSASEIANFFTTLYMINASRALYIGNYSNDTKSLSIQSTSEYLPYCNMARGCNVYSNGSYFEYLPPDYESSGTLTTTISSLDYEIQSKIYEVLSEYEDKIITPDSVNGGIESFDSDIPLNDTIIENIKQKAKSGKKPDRIISSISEYDDYKIYDIEAENIAYMYSMNSEYWWPIGSLTADENGLYSKTPANSYISSEYGYRTMDDGETKFHGGVDITSGLVSKETSCNYSGNGLPIIAAKSGVVESVYDGCDTVGYYGNQCGSSGSGNYVRIKHDDGNVSLYMHMQKGSVLVHEGDKVSQGQKIGNMGSSGSSTGCHLHFEIRVNDEKVNPGDYISIDNPRPSSEILGGSLNMINGGSGKESICLSLKNSGFSDSAIIAILINMNAESGCNPINLENSYENSLGYSDETYTSAVDRGTYSKDSFVYDSAGYGLVQWTYWSLKKELYENTRGKNKSVGDLQAQLSLLISQLSNSYPGVYSNLISNSTAAEKAKYFCLNFERPANKETNCPNRVTNNIDSYTSYVNNGCK